MEVSINEIKSMVRKVYSLAEQGDYLAIMIWGGTGVGKSQAVKQTADELGVGFIDLRLSLLNPVDLRGLPSIDKENQTARWLHPEFLPTEKKHGERGILFLDEMNLAPQAVMSAGYQLILDRGIGEYRLPKGWIIVGAGNRVKDQAVVTKFPAPLANRFIHLELPEPDIDDWKKWALNHNIVEQVIAFLSKMPQHLYHSPKVGIKVFPTPRSWTFASLLLKAGERIDPAIGGAVAGEFYAFIKAYDKMPDVEKILAGKEDKVPEEHDILWALSTAIIMRAKPAHVDNVVRYCEQMGKKGKKEFEVTTLMGITQRDDMFNKLAQAKTFEQWRKNNKEILKDAYEMERE